MEKSRQKASNSGAAGRMKDLRAKQFILGGFTYRELENGVSLSRAHTVRRENTAAMQSVPRLVSRPQGAGRGTS